MEKLSSEKTLFLRKTFPWIGIVLYAAFVCVILVSRFYIAAPVVLLFLIGLIRMLIKSSKIVDFYIDSTNEKIEIDNLSGKRFSYTIQDLVSIRHSEYFNYVKLKFRDKRKFHFYTRNMWALPGFDEPSVDARIKRLVQAKRSVI